MSRIENLKLIKEELDKEEDALSSFQSRLVSSALDSKQRYKNFTLIAEGSSKKVFKAHDSKMQREIAFAQIQSDVDDIDIKSKIIREARITAMLDHPNIAPLYDVGENDQGLYFTMKLLSGKKMSVLMGKSNSRDSNYFENLLQHFIHICDAVSYAHSKGVLHLDIKPSNVQIGEFGETYLFDWGISKLYQRASVSEKATDTIYDLEPIMENDLRGTPGYMSPEQAMGHESLLSPQTDVYLLGALLYSIYTGKRVLELGEDEDHLAVMKSGQSRLATHDIFENKIPNSINKIIKKAIQRSPEDRYDNVDALCSDIKRYLVHQPISLDQHIFFKSVISFIVARPYLVLSVFAFTLITFVGVLLINQYLNRIEIQYINSLSKEKSQTIEKILPFADLKERHILDLFLHPKAESMAETLIESRPDSTQAWMLKGMMATSRFDFEEANKAFKNMEGSEELYLSSQSDFFSNLAQKVLKLENRDGPYYEEEIIKFIKDFNSFRLTSLYCKNYYLKNSGDSNKNIKFLTDVSDSLYKKNPPKFSFTIEESLFNIKVEHKAKDFRGEVFLGFPYKSLDLSGIKDVYVPILASPTLKELDISNSGIDSLFFIPDLKLEKLNISGINVHKPFYGSMKLLKTLIADNTTINEPKSFYTLFYKCYNIEVLSAIGVSPKELLRTIKHLKNLKRLRCSDDQKKVIMKAGFDSLVMIPEGSVL